jgi:aminopeptidase N
MPSKFRARRLLSLTCCALALAAPALTPSASAQTPSTAPTQLPDVARPTHYAVHIAPDATKFTFDGHVTIDIEILKPTTTITLNAADMTISSAGLVGGAKASVALDKARETVTLTFPAALKPGKAKIELSYAGVIVRQANGLFALDYKDIDGKDARTLFTQFEPADARRVFPSWDEPAYKATFDLSATVPAGQLAIGNMPVASRKSAGDGRDMVVFQTSPKMSTYLLFFAVGDLERIKMMSGKTEIGIVTSRGQSQKGQFALESEAKIVGYYNDYFGVDYPLPKLDTVAGPGRSQFFSAMENWGAIFTFEYGLLNDPKLTTASQYQNIFKIGGHETAHQWFGDLVTMRWWDDIWLNEGFASWMETKATMHFFPEWEAGQERVSGRETAMALDGRVTTHPVVQKIETVDQMNQAFDAISYQKGEAIIAMLESFAGEDVWRSGMRLYMKRHAHSNTTTEDLWKAQENAGAKGVSAIAHDFTSQPGIPLIKLTDARCEAGSTHLTLTQSEFSSDRKDKTDVSPQRWHVPVAAMTLGGKRVQTVVTGGKGALTVPGCGPLLLNVGQTGYYRTLYTAEQLGALKANFAKLPAIDQFGLATDQLALAKAGYQPMSSALDVLAQVGSGSDRKLQTEMLERWTELYGLFRDDPGTQAVIAKHVSANFGDSLTRLGFTGKADEPLLDTGLRSALVSALGQMGDARVLAEARRLFAGLDNDPTAMDGPLRQTWLGVVARHATETDWQKLRAMANKASTQLERSTLFRLLGTAHDPKLAQAALNLALTDEPGRTDSSALVSAAAKEHPDLTIDFTLANADKVEALVDTSGRPRYVARMAAESRDPAMIGKLRGYAEKRLPASSRASIEQTVNLLEARTRLEPAIRAGVKAWLG